jgi:hypothetical protein
MNFLHKISRNHYSSLFKNVIVVIAKQWKMPPENYIQPKVWTLKFSPPSQVRLRAFLNSNKYTKLGPSHRVNKKGDYKNPEYFSYHPFTYYNIEEDLNCKRCRPQPSNKSTIVKDLNNKCP